MNGLININDIKNGMTIIYDGKLYLVQSFLHVKPGKGAAFMKVKMRNLRTGTIIEETINSNVKVEKAHVDKKKMSYIYNSGTGYVFMDNETYEQIEITEDKLADTKKFLKENLEVQIDFYQGEIIGVTLPEKIEYEVVETTEAVKGNTTNNAQKDATLENGYVVKVPLFITQGEKIIVSTIDGKYSSRA
ncbi:MAG TPA: elongation factor P [Candidatus Coprovivens excrementavium]|nr:elongation factor P [Candidatus Coprovivens excrementavium]